MGNAYEQRRRSIRLKGYDYSTPGYYFITICTQDRKKLFGDIRQDKMIMNEIGQLINNWWLKSESKFNNIELMEFIIMPNHFHGIILIKDPVVGADQRVCPKKGEHTPKKGEHTPKKGEHMGSPLPRIIQWFKTMTTNEYIRNVKTKNWEPFEKRLWQRNYYEHIIRNEDELYKITEYILYNPDNWVKDRNYI